MSVFMSSSTLKIFFHLLVTTLWMVVLLATAATGQVPGRTPEPAVARYFKKKFARESRQVRQPARVFSKQSATCEDTLKVAVAIRDRTTNVRGLLIGDSATYYSALAQYFPILDTFGTNQPPRNVTVKGAVVYLSFPNWSQSQNVDLHVYQADTNGLPVGSPVETATVRVVANQVRYDVLFNKAANFTENGYVLGVQNDNVSPITQFFGYFNPGFGSDFQVRIRSTPSGFWQVYQPQPNSDGIAAIVEPIVEYDIEGRYSVQSDTSCLQPGDVLSANAALRSSTILTNNFYNVHSISGNIDSSYRWEQSTQLLTIGPGINLNLNPGFMGPDITLDMTARMLTWTRGYCDAPSTQKTIPVYQQPELEDGLVQVLCRGEQEKEVAILGGGPNAQYGILDSSLQSESRLTLSRGNYLIEVRNGPSCIDTLILNLQASDDSIDFAISADTLQVGDTLAVRPYENGADRCRIDLGDESPVRNSCQQFFHQYQNPGEYTLRYTAFFPEGCTYEDSAQVMVEESEQDTVVGIGENPEQQNWRVYPHPAQERFYVAWQSSKPMPQLEHISLTDLGGRNWATSRIWSISQKRLAINTAGLPNGLYVLTLHGPNQPIRRMKVKVQH